MAESDWIERALTASTAEQVEACLQAWSPELLIAGRGEDPFSAELAVADPVLREIVELSFRNLRETDALGWTAEQLDEKLIPLSSSQRGAMLAGVMRLDRIRFEVGHPHHECASEYGGSWFGVMIWPLLDQIFSHDLAFEPDGFVRMVAMLHHGLDQWPEQETEGAYYRLNPPAAAPKADKLIEALVAWAPADGAGLSGLWLPALVKPLESAIDRMAPHEVGKYSVAYVADSLKALFRFMGEPDRASPALEKAAPHLAERALNLKNQAEHAARRRDEVDDERHEARKSGRWRRELERRRRPAVAIHIEPRPLSKLAPYPDSYFGGLPLMPEGVEWPSFTSRTAKARRAMTFVCQLDLAKLPPIRKSPLPNAGKLLVFVGIDFGEETIPLRIIHAGPGTAVAPTKPPDDVPDVYLEDDFLRPWLDDPELKRSHFRHACSFWPLDTYPDSEDGGGVLGWRFKTPHEDAYRELAARAAFRSERVMMEAKARAGPLREPAPPPRKQDHVAYFRGGPYVQEDAIILGREMKRALAARKGELMPPEGVDDEVARSRAEIVKLVEDAWAIAEQLEAGGIAAGRWSPFPEEDRFRLRIAIQQLRRRCHAVRRRAEAINRPAFLTHSRAYPDGASARAAWKPLTGPMLHETDLFGQRQGLMEFNLKRLVHEGVDIDGIWPQGVVDAIVPAPNVGVVPQSADAPDDNPLVGDPVLHQMLGWGTSVQSAPTRFAKKVLLLQVMGGEFPWLESISCVLQIWIDEKDARNGFWDRAFATVECN